jgi:hypothetical protein
MRNPKSRLLKEIRDLLRSVDKKLDRLLNHPARKVQGPSYDQKETPISSSTSRIGLSCVRYPAPFEIQSEQLDREIAAFRSILIEGKGSISARTSSTIRKDFVPGTFASLPEHLRQTMQAIVTFGEATALQVSKKTGRSRAAESDYLNQLVDRGFLKKTRRGREIVFQVFSLHTLCPMCGSRVPLNVKFCSYCGAALYRPQHQLAQMPENSSSS